MSLGGKRLTKAGNKADTAKSDEPVKRKRCARTRAAGRGRDCFRADG